MENSYGKTFSVATLIIFMFVSVVFAATFRRGSSTFQNVRREPLQEVIRKPAVYDSGQYLLEIDPQKMGIPRDTLINKRKKGEVLTIPVKFSNLSNQTFRYLSMSCSWFEFFETNNKSVEIVPWDCDANISTVRTVLPHSFEIYKLPILLSGNYLSGEKFSVGIKLIEVTKENEKSMIDVMDFRSLKNHLLWSNVVQIP